MNERLYRSRSDRMIAGVAGGLAERFDLDPSLVRVAWVLLALVTGGIFLVAYIVMAIVVPEDPLDDPSWNAPYRAAGPPTAGPATAFTSMTGDPTQPGSGAAGAAPVPPSGGAAPGTTPPGPGAAPIAASAPSAGAGPAPGSAGWSHESMRAQRRADRDARRAARRTNGSHTGAAIGGLILIVIGTYFLVRTALPDLHLEWFWPAALVLFGAILIVASIRRDPPAP
ncbi:MAG: PspC domain-containing protein [Candidatus Limnocylindrales bacterium]